MGKRRRRKKMKIKRRWIYVQVINQIPFPLDLYFHIKGWGTELQSKPGSTVVSTDSSLAITVMMLGVALCWCCRRYICIGTW